MSVIRRPGVLGRTTHQRVVGVTAALSATTVDAVAVGTWFAVVVHGRTTVSALAGLAVLLVGALARIRVFGVATDGTRLAGRPNRLVAAIGLATCWVGWLLVAESVGGPAGILVAGVGLTALLALQHRLETRVLRTGSAGRSIGDGSSVRSALGRIVPGVLAAVGATTLLASARMVDFTVVTTPVVVAGYSVVFEVGAFALGLLAFVICSFLCHQRRFQRALTS